MLVRSPEVSEFYLKTLLLLIMIVILERSRLPRRPDVSSPQDHTNKNVFMTATFLFSSLSTHYCKQNLRPNQGQCLLRRPIKILYIAPQTVFPFLCLQYK